MGRGQGSEMAAAPGILYGPRSADQPEMPDLPRLQLLSGPGADEQVARTKMEDLVECKHVRTLFRGKKNKLLISDCEINQNRPGGALLEAEDSVGSATGYRAIDVITARHPSHDGVFFRPVALYALAQLAPEERSKVRALELLELKTDEQERFPARDIGYGPTWSGVLPCRWRVYI